MLCIWRGAPDWPEGPPSAGDSSSIQPTRGLHDCFQPDARSSPATPGLAQVCRGEPARPRRRGARGRPAPSVSVEAQAAPAGWVGAWGRLGPGGGARGLGWWPRRHEIAADASAGEPRCPQSEMSPPGRPRLECQTGVLPVLRERRGWSVGAEEGGLKLAGLGAGVGGGGHHHWGEKGPGLALKWSGGLGSENKNLAGKLRTLAAWCVGDTVRWARGDLRSGPSDATCGWAALGKPPSLSEPRLQGRARLGRTEWARVFPPRC